MSFNTVALIDDDPSLVKIGSMALEKVGHKEVTSFSSGEEFLAHIQEASNSYDVILIDVNMPNLLGTEVIDKIVEYNPNFNIPIIFLTGTTDSKEVKELFNHAGVIGVISKPFDPMQLTNLVEDVMNEKLAA
jgi:two-component system, OmpR family, alkaline phosphatase synthesis response regulator PhoP